MRFKQPFTKKIFFLFLILGLFCIHCSTTNPSQKRASTSRALTNTFYDASPGSAWHPTSKNSIPTVTNVRVKKWIDLFNGKLRPNFKRWLGRLGHYGPAIEQVLNDENVPSDLIYLAMIESGFNLQATSHASAVGPWQFIRSTGQMYGLKSDFFVDDRQDLILATKAAAQHLKDLYKIYGDWYLAFAAYNAGPGTVSRAIKRTHSKNYWAISRTRYLKPETKDYVPKILAAMHIVKNYRQYGYSHQDFESPMEFDRVLIPDATDITVIAKSAGTTVDVIQKLNPALVSGITRPDSRVPIYIPKGRKELFMRKYASVPTSRRVQSLYHRVAPQESLKSIAKIYNMNASSLAQANNMSASQSLHSGQSLKIPTNKKVLLAMASKLNQGSSSKYKNVYYKVKKGDTLSRIAKKFKTKPVRIAKLNNIKSTSKLKIGQQLTIQKKSIHYTKGSNSLYAGISPLAASQKRLSGVAHIILQDRGTSAPEENTSFLMEEPAELVKSDLAKIMAMQNDFDPGNDNLPSVIRLASETEEETPQKKSVAEYHIVKSGDTLSRIAAKYQISQAHLKNSNGLKSNQIRAGQKLLIRPGAQSQIASNKTTPKNNIVHHRIKTGDTLWSLAKKYGVRVSDIKKWNNLTSDTLRLNQKVRIHNGSEKS